MLVFKPANGPTHLRSLGLFRFNDWESFFHCFFSGCSRPLKISGVFFLSFPKFVCFSCFWRRDPVVLSVLTAVFSGD